jgi:hypothetical protein
MSRHLLAVGAAVLALAGCASKPFTSTWTAPDVRSLNPAGKTIAVVFVSREESEWHAVEDALAADLTARDDAHGTAAYTLLPNDRREDGEAARARLKAGGRQRRRRNAGRTQRRAPAVTRRAPIRL